MWIIKWEQADKMPNPTTHNDCILEALQAWKRYHVHVIKIPQNKNIWQSIQTQENITKKSRDMK